MEQDKLPPFAPIRSVIFNILFTVVHVGLVIMMAIFAFLPQRYMVGMLEFTMRSFAWLERNILGLTYVVTGQENIPQGCYIFASKHQSIWETYKLHLLMKNPAVIMKKELMQIPFWGRIARKVDAIGVDRGAGGAALRSLIAGGKVAKAAARPIVIFPQGTRLPPEEYRPYKYGVAALYNALDVPLIPVALNSGLYWPRNSFLKRPGVIKVEILPPIMPGLKSAAALEALEAVLEPATKRLVEEAKRGLS